MSNKIYVRQYVDPMFRETEQFHNYNLKAKTTQVSHTSGM